RIRPGEMRPPGRVPASASCGLAQGKGRTVIDGRPYDWSKGDILALPSWALHEHANTGKEDAILFSIHDRPVIEALGFYREEALVGNRGDQHLSVRNRSQRHVEEHFARPHGQQPRR